MGMNEAEVERRVAIVTGGGTGVGAATACTLAERGYNVAINYSHSENEAEATASQCREMGVDAVAVKGDVSNDEDCRRVVSEAVDRWGRLDALISSAGITQFVPMTELERQNAEDFHKVYAVNLIGPYQMARAAAPHLRRTGRGSIVHVSSISALSGSGSSFAYVTSKAALNTLTLALARTLAPEVRVNAVLPGLIESRWLPAGLGNEAYARVRENWISVAALEKACTPRDVAKVISWLVSDAALVTGQLINIDGGFLLGRPTRVSR
jgi:3-oxoacyl-[acyl-carrier protein] reductase